VHSLACNGLHCFRWSESKSNLSYGLEESLSLAPKLQFRLCLLLWGNSRGPTLTTLFGDAKVSSSKKHSLLPMLTIVFLISYGLLAWLVVEQNNTIQAQKTLIRQMFGDNTELTALKIRINREKNQAQARAQAQAPVQPGTPGQSGGSNHSTGRMQKSAPQKPPKPTSDTMDVRRALNTI